MKLVEWNIHKMTKDISVKPFVIDTLAVENADVMCLIEYLTDTGIKGKFEEEYWIEESNTISGNKVLIAVKKDFAPDGITVKNKEEVQECYNFMHIEFKLQNGNPLSVIGVRMLSPMNAKKQTPSLKEYISKLTTPFLCVGDYNIKKSRMGKWFPSISIGNLRNTNCSLSDSSIIYVDKNSCQVTGFGAVDHVLHSDDIEVNSEYKWDFLRCDSIYPCVDNISISTYWNIPPAYPDHALMISNIEKKEKIL